MTWQVRKLSESNPLRDLGKRWQVVGSVNGWPAHYPTRTKAEAEQVKANVKDELSPWLGFEQHDAPDFEAWEMEVAS